MVQSPVLSTPVFVTLLEAAVRPVVVCLRPARCATACKLKSSKLVDVFFPRRKAAPAELKRVRIGCRDVRMLHCVWLSLV